MITTEQYQRFLHQLPVLRKADGQLAREFQQTVSYARIPAGRDVFAEGDAVDSIALLISGVVRVYKISETGREITLYRFGLGESCVLTANAILSRKTFPAIATVEEDAEALIIPADAFRKWVNRYDIWRDFVFDLLSDRLSTIMTVIDEVVFQRMDRRVALWLLNQAETQNPILVTHQMIAADLGSSREVISRILEDFSRAGIIESGRGAIEILEKGILKERSVV